MGQRSDNRGARVSVSRALRVGSALIEPMLIFAMLMMLAYAGQQP